MAGMGERKKEWQNGRMAEMATYILFMVHANNDDTLVFYITDLSLFLLPDRLQDIVMMQRNLGL